ncbi:MAG: hypothetical protein KIT43_04715 [Bauldia sp.]|nr:hypothetical protein [Bauldia sp.]
MSKLEDIEKAVAALAPKELARFREWYAAFDAEQFDAKIAADAASGALDGLAEEAMRELAAGRTRPL